MRKEAKKNLLFDKMHRGVVYACIGMTLYGSYLLGLRVHRYFTVIRPAKKQEELKMIEGSSDTAPTLKA